MVGICMEYVRITHGIGMASVSNTYGICVDNIWNKYGLRMEYVWNIYGIRMEYVSNTDGTGAIGVTTLILRKVSGFLWYHIRQRFPGLRERQGFILARMGVLRHFSSRLSDCFPTNGSSCCPNTPHGGCEASILGSLTPWRPITRYTSAAGCYVYSKNVDFTAGKQRYHGVCIGFYTHLAAQLWEPCLPRTFGPWDPPCALGLR